MVKKKEKVFTEKQVEIIANIAYLQGAIDFDARLINGWDNAFDRIKIKLLTEKNLKI